MSKSYTPQYIRIRNDVINRINNGNLKKGDRLPSERDFADLFGVSRITVVGALRELEDQGIIRKIRGSGSYVNCSSVQLEDSGDMFTSFFCPARTTITHGMLVCPPQTFFIVKTLAALFRMENPDIKVDVKVLNPKGYVWNEDPYLDLIGGGNPPTTGEFFFHSDYSALNALYPLENMPGFQELVGGLIPGATFPTLDMSGNPHIHAIALKVNARHCAVNLDFLAKAGIRELPDTLTFEHLDDWCPRLGAYAKTHPGNYGACSPLPHGWHNVIGYFPYMWGENGPLDSSAGSFLDVLRGDSARIGLAALSRWYANSHPVPPGEEDLFSLDRVGMFFAATMRPLLFKEMLTRNSRFRYYAIPTAPGAKSSASLLGNFSTGIFRGGVKNEDELQAAWRWLKFLFQKRVQYQLSLDFDFPTCRDSDSRINELPAELSPAILGTIRSAKPQFDFKNIRASLSILGDELRSCIQGKLSPEKCLENSLRRLPDVLRLS